MASYKAFLFALLFISCVIASEADLSTPQTVVKKVVRIPSGRTYKRRKDTIFDAAAKLANGLLGKGERNNIYIPSRFPKLTNIKKRNLRNK